MPPNDLSEDKRREIALESFECFRTHFFEHKIYFNKNVCLKLNRYIVRTLDIISKFMFKKLDTKNFLNTWREVANEYETNILEVKKELEDDFRRLLGPNIETS